MVMSDLLQQLKESLPSADAGALASAAIRCAVVTLLALLSYYLARAILIRGVGKLIRRSRTELDDILLERHVLRRLSMLVPIVVLYYAADALPGSPETVRQLLNSTLTAALVLLAGAVINLLSSPPSLLFAPPPFSRCTPERTQSPR